jgi:hypothetical protein
MASVISASTTSGTALNMTADTSGQLQLATGATPTTAVTINTSQNVGIGTTTIASSNIRTQISGQTSNTEGFTLDQGQLFINDSDNTTSSGLMVGYRYDAGVAEYARLQATNGVGATNIVMQAGGGNVGIGTASPSTKLQVTNSTAIDTYIRTTNSVATSGFDIGVANTGDSYVYVRNNTPLIFGTNSAERMRIDSAGNLLVTTNTSYGYQAAPTAKAAAATLTGAELLTGILSTTGTTYTITLPTGTNIDAAVSTSLAANGFFDWWVVNTATGAITIGANGNTTLGSLTIALATSAQFRFRKTAANTYTVYRLG